MSDRMTGKAAPIQLMWNDSVGEGWILFATEFQDWDDVTKLDMLKDFIYALEQEYQEQLDIVFGDTEE